MKLNSNAKNIIYICSIIMVLFVVTIVNALWYNHWNGDEIIVNGVYVDDVHVGGLTIDEAQNVIENHVNIYLEETSVTITNGETQAVIPAIEIAQYDTYALAVEAYDISRKDRWWDSYKAIFTIKYKKHIIEANAIIDKDKIYDHIKAIESLFYIKPIDSTIETFSFINNIPKIVAKPSKMGYYINVDKTTENVFTAFSNKENHVNAYMEQLQPDILSEDLINMSIYEHIQTYEMCVNSSTLTQEFFTVVENCKPALLHSGDSLSIKEYLDYNKYAGLETNVVSLYIPSAIYVASVKAELDIIKRSTGSYIPESMYQPGQEAVLSHNQDLIIKNNKNYPMILVIEFNRKAEPFKLSCKVYSPIHDKFIYVRSYATHYDDRTEVNVFRVYANDTGGIIGRELIDTIQYLPTPVIVDTDIDISMEE